MSVNSKQNNTYFPGYNPAVESTRYGTAAPTATTAGKQGDTWFVTPSGDSTTAATAAYYYDAVTSSWIKFPGSASSSVKAQLEPVRAQVTAAEQATLTPNNGDRYILLDGANKGKIAVWDAATSTWLYYAPTNLDQTTVTTNAFGDDPGVYQYDSTSQTWVLIQQGIDLPDPEVRPTAGNFALPIQRDVVYADAFSPMLIANDGVMSYNADTLLNAGDNTNSNYLPHKVSWNWSNLIAGSYAKGASYAPVFVDAAMNTSNSIAIDSVGKPWLIGSNVTNTGFTTTPAGTTLVATAPIYGYAPIPFFHSRGDILCRRVYTAPQYNTTAATQIWALLTVEGNLWLTGNNTNGLLGQGNTTTPVNTWVQYPVSNVVDVKICSTSMFVQTSDGSLYITGSDAGGLLGTVNAAKTVPTLLTTNVKTFDVGDYTGIFTNVVKNDNTLWNGGTNTNGQLGRGNTTSLTSLTQVPGIVDAKAVFCSRHAGNPKTALLRTDGSLSFAGRNGVGEMGYAANAAAANNTSFVTPALSAQGTITDVHIGNNTTHIVTATGTVWNAGTVGYRGMGTSSSVWADANKWQQVSLQEGVVGLRVYTDSSGNDSAIALCKNHKAYAWGYALTENWNGNAGNWAYSPVYVPVEFVENGVAISNPLETIVGKTGVIATASAMSVTSIVDGNNGQTVTFTFSVDAGTAGTVDISGSSFVAAGVTQVSQTTTSLVINQFPQTVNVSFVVDAADLISTGSQPQDWVLTLMVNGA